MNFDGNDDIINLEDVTLVSILHQQLPSILDRLDSDADTIEVSCDNCDWRETYTPQHHESDSMMAARMDAAIVLHTESETDHSSYSVGITTTAQLDVINTSITID
jgi:hypothetical protein